MASENTRTKPSPVAQSTSENTRPSPKPRRGRAPVELPGRWSAEQETYLVSLASAPLSAQARRTYASKARQYLAWLAVAETDGDPLDTGEGRDWAVRDYRSHLQAVLKRRPGAMVTFCRSLQSVGDQ